MKRAIVAVSFGTTHKEAEIACIRPVERALETAFPDWTVRRAWTSRIIASRLKARGENVENVDEALSRLRIEGCDSIVLVSTHIIRGREYELAEQSAGGLPVSAPLLDSDEDLLWMAELLREIAREEGRTLLMMGHGTDHTADETYARLRTRLPGNVKQACVEGRYSLDDLLPELDRLADRRITLMPLMLVAGDHAVNDMAGPEPDSWKSRLEARGFDVRVRLQGLGAIEAVQRRFVEKTAQCISQSITV